MHPSFFSIFCLHDLCLPLWFCDAHAGLLDNDMYFKQITSLQWFSFLFSRLGSNQLASCFLPAQICIWIHTAYLLSPLQNSATPGPFFIFSLFEVLHLFALMSIIFSKFLTLSLIYLSKFKILWRSLSNRSIMEWVAMMGRSASTISFTSLWLGNHHWELISYRT